ncbi:hypothetical protein [Rhizobium leguminosarum]|uniref:hypothetical protein n=1 Tax=Rhizobium leguminosarum TaxID=384 RepID=UPI0015DA314F|nr:hypothetical protein [Rhizobium leguminosarum]NZD50784.1 hypothetical protein [Rhizobium leguminosarum]
MSDTILRYVPADPYWQPSPEAATKAVSLLETIAPGADEVKSSFEDEVRFYDPGDINTVAPCCGATVSLNDLRYVWPAAFGRFALEAHNPGIGDTTWE